MNYITGYPMILSFPQCGAAEVKINQNCFQSKFYFFSLFPAFLSLWVTVIISVHPIVLASHVHPLPSMF